MFKKKEISINKEDDFNPDKVMFLSITFNDRLIFKSYGFMFTENDVTITMPKNTKICDNATICVIATLLSGKRFIQMCKILNKSAEKITCERNLFQELPERRQTVKVKCDMSCYVEGYNIEEFDASITNISIGGVFLKTNKNIDLGVLVKLTIPEIKLDTNITIFRQQEDFSGYGCKFAKLTEEQVSQINKKIFDLQREERRILLKLLGVS